MVYPSSTPPIVKAKSPAEPTAAAFPWLATSVSLASVARSIPSIANPPVAVTSPGPSAPPVPPPAPPAPELAEAIAANPANCMIPILNSPEQYRAYRISPEDKNRIAILFDPSHADISLAVCVEIFDPGGHTPRHRHPQAAEMFFVLRGEGMAFCDGKAVALKTGDSILVPPNSNHAIQNSSDRRLYLLCIMVPNEDFIELIRNGIPVELDAEDLAVLRGLGHPPAPIA